MIKYPEQDILLKLQRIFEKTLSVYAFCYGRPYVKLLEPDAAQDAQSLFDRAVVRDERQLLVASFSDHPVENIIEGQSEVDYVKCRAVSIRDNGGRCVAVWIFIALCAELIPDEELIDLPEGIRTTSEKDLDDAMPLVEQLGNMYFSLYDRDKSLHSEMAEFEEVRGELAHERRRNEVLEEILELLESDQEFSAVVNNILHIAGEYAGTDDAALLRKHRSTGRVDIVSEWKGDSLEKPLSEVLKDIEVEKLPFFNDRPYTVSSGSSLPGDFAVFFEKYGITAGIFLPLEINDSVSMYIAFMIMGGERKWAAWELHFFNSIKRVIQSILNKRMISNSLAGSYAALDAILEKNGCGICVSVPGERDYLYTNELFSQMLPDPRDEQDFINLLDGLEREQTYNDEYMAQVSSRWFSIQSAWINWVDGRRVRIATLFEITSSKAIIEKIRRATYTDYLTGLYNRQRFENDFSMLLKDAARADESGTFMYLNLDDFKDINGGPGLRAGDEMLRATAKALLDICRSRATCYRIGGDEFAVLVSYSENERSRFLIETIQHRFEQPWRFAGEDFYCTMSMGVVTFPQDGREVDELMQHAQVALGIAKKKGRGKAEYYNIAAHKSNIRRIEMEKAMRLSADGGCDEFEVFFKPLVGLVGKEQRCTGAGVEIRWNSSELGVVGPDEFIPMAEYLGFLIPIYRHVIEQACTSCKRWNDFGNPDFKVSINLSVYQITQEDIIGVIHEVIRDTGIEPANLVFEIIESTAIPEAEKIKDVIRRVRKMGVVIEANNTPLSFLVEEGAKGRAEASGFSGVPDDLLKSEEFEKRYVMK